MASFTSTQLPAPARKDKVLFILGATGSGKSKLSIALAKRFNGEVINSDKMQVYDGLDVITNKVTEEEAGDVTHHLLGGVHPDANFTAADFVAAAKLAVESIIARGRLPVVAGGSNSFVEELVEGNGGEFRARYDCCFLWVDVSLVVLHDFVGLRVDKMVEQGLVEEARSVFHPEVDYTVGIRKSIGVPEMDGYFRAELSADVDEEAKAAMLAAAIDEIKANTCKLTYSQLQKIMRFATALGWDVKRVDSTDYFLKRAKGQADESTWEQVVGAPATEITRGFLNREAGQR